MAQTKVYVSPAARQKAFRQRQAARIAELHTSRIIPTASAIENLPSRNRWTAQIQNAANALTAARDEMQAYFDSRSESWQEGDKASEMQETLDTLEELITQIEAVKP